MHPSRLFNSRVLVLLIIGPRWALTAAQNGGRAEPDPCAKVAAQEEQSRHNLRREDRIDAQAAFDCINQIPLDATAALSVIRIIKEYTAFQSTLSSLKNPPASFQQPAVDIMSSLDRLADTVGAGRFDTQYSFEVAMHSIFAQARDGHLAPEFGLLGFFQWRLLHSIVCVSTDGQQLPQVYVGTDTRPRRWRNASPIVELQGEPVFTYLEKYADARILATIDPHADWNKIMINTNERAARSYDAPRHAFDSTRIYNGPVLSGRFANGSSFEWPYYAVTEEILPKGMTADWIAEFVGLAKPVEVASSSGLNSHVNPGDQKPLIAVDAGPLVRLSGHVDVEAQRPMFGPLSPRAEELNANEDSERLYQAADTDWFDFWDLDEYATGPIGHVFKGVEVAVLALPFWYCREYTGSRASSVLFSKYVASFISKAKEVNVTKVIIDVRGDSEEGFLFQAFDTAKRFFPGLEPSISFRAHASPQLNLLGSAVTYYLQHGREAFSLDDWARMRHYYGSMAPLSANQTLNADGEAWASWADFFSPDEAERDGFTKPTRYNLSNPDIASIFGQDIAGYNSNQLHYEQPWPAKDIILVHDGTCGSTCAIFSEILKTDAGVRSVAVGGLPLFGPMQGVGGTRGGFMLSWQVLSDLAESIRVQFEQTRNGSLSEAAQRIGDEAFDGFTQADIDGLLTHLSSSPWRLTGKVNMLDSVRASAPGEPLHFAFESADCRLFFTREMVRGAENIWLKAFEFMNGNVSVCVPGSTKGPAVGSDDVVMSGTQYPAGNAWASIQPPEVPPRRPEEPTMRPGNEAWMRDIDPSNPPLGETWLYMDDANVHLL